MSLPPNRPTTFALPHAPPAPPPLPPVLHRVQTEVQLWRAWLQRQHGRRCRGGLTWWGCGVPQPQIGGEAHLGGGRPAVAGHGKSGEHQGCAQAQATQGPPTPSPPTSLAPPTSPPHQSVSRHLVTLPALFKGVLQEGGTRGKGWCSAVREGVPAGAGRGVCGRAPVVLVPHTIMCIGV